MMNTQTRKAQWLAIISPRSGIGFPFDVTDEDDEQSTLNWVRRRGLRIAGKYRSSDKHASGSTSGSINNHLMTKQNTKPQNGVVEPESMNETTRDLVAEYRAPVSDTRSPHCAGCGGYVWKEQSHAFVYDLLFCLSCLAAGQSQIDDRLNNHANRLEHWARHARECENMAAEARSLIGRVQLPTLPAEVFEQLQKEANDAPPF
jgi:hypothetical protein